MRYLLCTACLCFLCMPHAVQASVALPEKISNRSPKTAATIKGTVIDKETRLPIPFATISVVAHKMQFQANSKGAFTLAVQPEMEQAILQVSSLGYETGEFAVADLLRQQKNTGNLKLALAPKQESLNMVEVRARSRKWKPIKVGYHIDEGTPIHHEIYPSDTIRKKAPGQEIGSRIVLKKKPAKLQSVSFGLAGSGGERAVIRIQLYSLKDDKPHRKLLSAPATIAIPAHHTGWITVPLSNYDLTLQEDVAVVLEWLTETSTLTTSTLMAFATHPKDQLIYYRESGEKPWQILKSTLINSRSFGMYVTLLYEK